MGRAVYLLSWSSLFFTLGYYRFKKKNIKLEGLKYVSIRLRLLISYIAMIIIPVVFPLLWSYWLLFFFEEILMKYRTFTYPSNEPEEISIQEKLIIDTHQQSTLKSRSIFESSLF